MCLQYKDHSLPFREMIGIRGVNDTKHLSTPSEQVQSFIVLQQVVYSASKDYIRG